MTVTSINARSTHANALLFIATAALAVCASSACAQNFPTRPVRIIVPLAAGGSTDVLSRLVGAKLSE